MGLQGSRARMAARCLAAVALVLLCAGCQAPDGDTDLHAGKGHHKGMHGGRREDDEALSQAQVQAQTSAQGQVNASSPTPSQAPLPLDERTLKARLAEMPDGRARLALLDRLARADAREGHINDYFHVLDLIASDSGIAPGRRSLAASELATAYAYEKDFARSHRALDDAKSFAAETKDADLDALPANPAYAVLRAEAVLAWRYRGQFDVALRLNREATDLAWRDLGNASLSPARRHAAANELISDLPTQTNLLIRCNRATEALSYVEELRWDLDNGPQLHPTTAQRAQVARARALALTSFDDYDAALASIDEAIDGFREAGMSPVASPYAESLRLRLLIALAMGRIGDYRTDVAGWQTALASNPTLGFGAEEGASLAFAAGGNWREAQRSIDENNDPERIHRHKRKRSLRRGTDNPAAKFDSALAMLYRLEDPQGDLSEADIASYVEPSLGSDDEWDDEGTRGGIIDDGVLALSMARLMNDGATGQALAFRIAELFHMNATQGAMNDGATRLAAQTPALRALIEQEAALRYQLETSASSSSDAEDKLRALRREIASQFPRYRELVAPAIPTPEAVGAVLHAGEVYVDLYAGREASYAFVVRPDHTLHAVVLPVTRATLAKQVAALRAGFDAGMPPTQPGDLAGFDLNAAAGLYRALIAPIEADVQGAKTVYLSTSGILSSIPYEVLLRRPASSLADADWWLDSTTPVRMPSASALVSARAERVAHASEPLVAFADPSFDGRAQAPQEGAAPATVVGARAFPIDARTLSFDYRRVTPLPETLDEANAIAVALGASPQQSVISGLAASRTHVLGENLSNDRVVLFATHGVIPGEVPGLRKAGLALAYEGRGLPDSILTADDIVTLRLNADWVVLSACNTGLATGDAGDSVSALARAFFAAGARSLLVTQWAVESKSAALVTSGLFDAYAANPALSKADALAQTERAMAAGKEGALYRHPYYWAAYFLAGDAQR
ncbi:CHAT domain-containing protein [Paraburkholderia pallida]|uniref:CHAT domain-containing protein n=1 Tax=Paraburkholderia pallida TaxID=2547399 RepID=A0A4P7CSF2_9BURK|nr:CHAT domain-containing protein [Paraburkholderia pallida]QBQ97134.1 CHAT domain-containing protein [Paraburkholderia pallida]